MNDSFERKPDWLKIQLNTTENFRYLKRLMREERLTTVCEEARCPNIHECWGKHKTATFMVLGEICTRRCRFCAVKTGVPLAPDWGEPQRVAESVAKMGLAHAVITMVNRDDLADGGASVVAETVRAIRGAAPGCAVELLTGDFQGDREALGLVLESEPEVMGHNLETVRRLSRQVRSRSDYDRSLGLLAAARDIAPGQALKSSLMLGLGETEDEVLVAMDDLLGQGVTILNLGQYLQPTRRHLPVQRYWTPGEFARLRERALEKGFSFCDAGPLVRSSYHAGAGYLEYLRNAKT
ncbi:lipoyl synthase [Alkalispirochaeta sphaeroplastigenens]|uniref:Lipoyl synthase n=1 Tax=Alkalispirochaeta sphaeroplastigenens TaxID=1187066 RepID=A0A2S4JGA7_9SPIO|nr:lipoyl synthase [Alkalispirochaeta sphaeroplastigenens]POQ98562.1 lipoyl synthase [Alkalispirochaeta sphaeroplastigenens]